MSQRPFRNLVCACGRPHCHWCGRDLSLDKGPTPGTPLSDQTTTRDHVPYAGHPRVVTVLACRRCNSSRGQSTTGWTPWHDRHRVTVSPWVSAAAVALAWAWVEWHRHRSRS